MYSRGGRDTQIDYWLIRRPHLNLVTNVKVIPSTNSLGPQHRLLMMDLRLNLGQQRQPPITSIEKIKWWRLYKSKSQLVVALGLMDPNGPVDTIWDNIASQIHDATLGKMKPGRHFIDKQVWWWNDSVQQTIRGKKQHSRCGFSLAAMATINITGPFNRPRRR